MSEPAVAVETPVAAPPPAPVAEPVDANAATGDDILADARAQARKLLFEGQEPETGGESEGEEKPPVEAKPEPPKEEPPKKEDTADEVELSKKWAKFRSQESRLVKRQKEFAAQQAEFEARSKALEEREVLMNDPVAFLGKAGWDKDRITQWIMGDGKVDPELLIKQVSEKHQKELEALRAERAKERAELEEAQRKRQLNDLDAQLGDYVGELVKGDNELGVLKRLVERRPEKLKFLHQRVGSIIAEVYKKSQQVVAPRDALLYLQRELAELQLSDPGQAPAVKPATPVAVEPAPITNKATSQRTVTPVDYDEEDPEARRRRSRAILAGEIEADE